MQPQTNDMIYEIIGGVFGALATVFLMSRLIASRIKTIVNKWATENGFEVLSGKVIRFPFKGPFKWWTNGRGQMICFLKVRGRDGQERSCWIRCGNRFGGIWLGNQAEVKWQDQETVV